MFNNFTFPRCEHQRSPPLSDPDQEREGQEATRGQEIGGEEEHNPLQEETRA